jgi:DNA-directed RNA polymerase subunit K/omega
MIQPSLDEDSYIENMSDSESVNDDGDEGTVMSGGGGEYSDDEYIEDDDNAAANNFNEAQIDDENEEGKNIEDETENSEEEADENYLMKFDKEIRKNYLLDYHPESLISNYDEIQALVNIKRDTRGIIIDEFHKTIPFLTKYEKTRVLGQRAKQINSGAKPYLDKSNLIDHGKPIIDGYLIALKELELKKIPFIIRRPLPNGGSEYWKLDDLEIIN